MELEGLEVQRVIGNRGAEGIEGIEVALEVTRARVETSPLWRLLIRN